MPTFSNYIFVFSNWEKTQYIKISLKLDHFRLIVPSISTCFKHSVYIIWWYSFRLQIIFVCQRIGWSHISPHDPRSKDRPDCSRIMTLNQIRERKTWDTRCWAFAPIVSVMKTEGILKMCFFPFKHYPATSPPSFSTSLGAGIPALSSFMHSEHLIRQNQTKTHKCWGEGMGKLYD